MENDLAYGSGEAPPPRAAATIVPLREASAGLEVLLTRRPRHLRFMGGATVFPGGAVAEGDKDPGWAQVSALDARDAARLTGVADPDEALGYYICALRESFEEVGLVDGINVARLSRPSADDARAFLVACLEHQVTLATDRLVYAGRWVTPLGAPLRFDTHFFLLETQPGWEPSPDPSEVESCEWMTPARALAGVGAGELLMAPPTVEMLQRLDAHGSAAEASAAAAQDAMDGPGAVLSARLSPLVHVVLAPNPGIMTGPGTNTYIVGSGPTCVIDPAVSDEDYLDEVIRVAGEVASIVVTHRHGDHVGGVAALARASGAPVRAFGSAPTGSHREIEPLGDGDTLDAGGATLRALHTPGHSSDHLCLLLEGAASLFSGDNVLGEGTAVIAPPDGDMAAYLDSLERLRRLGIDRIYPGHFRPLDGGASVIEGYIAHRRQREALVLAALGPEPSTLEQIVEHAYADTPAHLHPVARFSALAHLEMLESNGHALRRGDRWMKG